MADGGDEGNGVAGENTGADVDEEEDDEEEEEDGKGDGISNFFNITQGAGDDDP